MQASKARNYRVPGILSHLRMPYLLGRFKPKYIWAAFVFINSFITIGYLALLAYITHFPLAFPSLGPTAYLFFLAPASEAAKPKNALLGHAVAIVCGYLALLITGLVSQSSVIVEGVSGERILAASLALAFTGAIMVLSKISHPPAGATTLIIALGFITQPFHLVIIEVAVVLLVLQSILINRLANIAGVADRSHS